MFVNVVDFGADPLGNVDSSEAFRDAIQWLAQGRNGVPSGGGTIEVPSGTYKFSSTVHIYNKCVIRGAGSGSDGLSAGTIIKADPGVTAFRIGPLITVDSSRPWSVQETGDGTGSILEHLCILAADREFDSITATLAAEPNTRLASTGEPDNVAVLTYSGDFSDTWKEGQLIRIPGAAADYWKTSPTGHEIYGIPLDGVSARTDGNPERKQLLIKPSDAPGIIPGAYYVICADPNGAGEDFYPLPTRCLDVDRTTGVVTMEDERPSSAENDAGNHVYYAPDLLTRIVHMDRDTERLALDWAYPLIWNKALLQSADKTPLRIEHADAGVDMVTQCSVQNCIIGSIHNPFRGPAIAIRGDTKNDESCGWLQLMADDWCVFNTELFCCRHGLYIIGVDASAGLACRVHCLNAPVGLEDADHSQFWAFLDQSQHSNTYLACHVNGLGWMRFNQGAGLTSLGCYVEDGTASHLGINPAAVPPLGGTLI